MKLCTIALLFIAANFAIVKASGWDKPVRDAYDLGSDFEEEEEEAPKPKATPEEEAEYNYAKELAADLVERARFERSEDLAMALQLAIMDMERDAARGGFYASNFEKQANRLRAFLPDLSHVKPEGKQALKPRVGLAARGAAAPEEDSYPGLAEAMRLSLGQEPRPVPTPAPAAAPAAAPAPAPIPAPVPVTPVPAPTGGPRTVAFVISDNPFFEIQGGGITLIVTPVETHASLTNKVLARFASFGATLTLSHVNAMMLSVILNNGQVVDVERNSTALLTTPANPVKSVNVGFIDDEAVYEEYEE